MGLLGVSMEKTVGDYIKNFYINYLAPSRDEFIGKKENKVINPRNAAPDQKNAGFVTKKLSMEKCRQVAEQTPLFMKGVRKKAMDSVRAWHKIDTKDGESKPVSVDLQIIDDFIERDNFKHKWYMARVDSFVYGDGFLLITFKNDEKTKLSEPPSKDAVPYSTQLISPEKIDKIDFYPEKKEFYRNKGIKHFHFQDRQSGERNWIHPDRIIHLPGDRLSYSEFGNSKINLLRNIIKSKINVDIACGEILSWFAHGVYDIGIANCGDNDIKRWEEIANDHPGAWIHDKEREEIKSVNPTTIDPKPFYDYLVLNIASAIVMPVHVLTGVQVGRVTGAEVGTGDYYKDIRDDQDLLYSPLLTKLYKWLLRGHNYPSDEKPPKRRWKYKIVWNQIYIDERSEAEILKTRVDSAAAALNGPMGGVGFIDEKEAREMINKGQIELDIDKKPKKPTPPQPMPKPEKPKLDDDEENEYTRQLDVVEKAMIRKRKEIAERERKIGEKVLKEQKDVYDSSNRSESIDSEE